MAVVQRGITITQPSTVTATDFNNLVDLATVSNVLVADIDASAKDPAAATPGLRTLGSGATQAAAGNHTHTITASDLADGAVTNPKLADMAQNTIKGRGYLRARAASVADVSIASAPATIDGVTLANGDRVLLKNQLSGAENGIRVFVAVGVAMARATDFDSASEILFDTDIAISEGTTNAGTNWTLTTTGTIVVDTTVLTFSVAAGGGQAQDLTPAQARDVLDIEPDGSTLEINSGSLRVKGNGIALAKMGTGFFHYLLNYADAEQNEINTTTAETSLFNPTAPLGYQASQNRIIVRALVALRNNSGSARTYILKVKSGATVLKTMPTVSVPNSSGSDYGMVIPIEHSFADAAGGSMDITVTMSLSNAAIGAKLLGAWLYQIK